MDLILELNRRLDMGVMLITHDLSVVAEVCSRVVVMYLGQIVEEANVDALFDHPGHPYTVGLIRSISRCFEEMPELCAIGPRQSVRCWRAGESFAEGGEA